LKKSALDQFAVLPKPVVLKKRVLDQFAVFASPVVFESKELSPMAVLNCHELLFCNAPLPIITLLLKLPHHRPTLIPFIRISPITSNVACGVFVPIPSLPVALFQ
jgi:hypothetical protein